MPPKSNPLKLNPLQLRTLALLQEIARIPDFATPLPESGGYKITQLPHAHGDHFHIGNKVASSKDATGLTNPAVWAALQRKGLTEGDYPYAVTLTKAAMDYDTSEAGHLVHGGDH